MVNIAINGFGRIGRNVLRALYESGRNNEFNVVAINDIAKPEGIAHLLKYDTAHGRFRFDVALENNTLKVAGSPIQLLAEPDINHLPWQALCAALGRMQLTGLCGLRVHTSESAEM